LFSVPHKNLLCCSPRRFEDREAMDGKGRIRPRSLGTQIAASPRAPLGLVSGGVKFRLAWETPRIQSSERIAERGLIRGTDDQNVRGTRVIWRAYFTMCEPTSAFEPGELARRLEPSGMSARDLRAMFHDPEFQAISDRNSKRLSLQ
jgi:hypothetical protein